MSHDLIPAATRVRTPRRRTVAGSRPQRNDRDFLAAAQRTADIKWANDIGLTILFIVLGVGAVAAQLLDGVEYNATATLVRIVASAIFAGGCAAVILVPAKVGRAFRSADR